MTDAKLVFTIQPSSGAPIYRQIMDQVRALAASGRLKPGDMLPSIRELAADLEVNMMTVSKAYARLEADGVLERQRGSGMRIAANGRSAPVSERQKELKPLVEELVTRAQQLGLTEQQIQSAIRSTLKERNSWSKQSSTSAT